MLVAVPVLVVPYVVVEVAVDDDGAELEDVVGAVVRPSRACNAESVLDDESAGSLDHAGGDRPALLECLVVAHVLAVVLQVSDGLVHGRGGGCGGSRGSSRRRISGWRRLLSRGRAGRGGAGRRPTARWRRGRRGAARRRPCVCSR